MNVSLIIPAFNEAEGVSQTAANLRGVVAEMRKSNEVEIVVKVERVRSPLNVNPAKLARRRVQRGGRHLTRTS